jgi:hypothetical protein
MCGFEGTHELNFKSSISRAEYRDSNPSIRSFVLHLSIPKMKSVTYVRERLLLAQILRLHPSEDETFVFLGVCFMALKIQSAVFIYFSPCYFVYDPYL